MNRRSKENLTILINNYLTRNELFCNDAPWKIKESTLGGFGLFAKRDIDPGEVIFRDLPVIFGPRFLNSFPELCINCFSESDLKSCENKCGLFLCSKRCEKSENHREECNLIQKIKHGDINQSSFSSLMKCLAPLRSLLLSENDKEILMNLTFHRGNQHGREVDVMTDILHFDVKDDEDYLRLICSILDANAYEVIGNEDNKISFRGLYPLGSLVNHRCFPNAFHIFGDNREMIVRAAVFIQKNTEIFHTYTRILWSTTTRTYYLQNTKHFICKCVRCRDPTEFGTYMNAVLCDMCKGNVVLTKSLKKSEWKCEDCERIVSFKEIGRIMMLVGSVLGSFENTDFRIMYSFLREKLATMVPDSNQMAVEIKYKIIWTLGHTPGYSWQELSIELLNLKKTFCQDILKLLKKLKIGQCKMRGMLLFEMYLCLEEMNKRDPNLTNDLNKKGRKYLTEASDILRYDVCASKLVKQKWHQLN